MPGPSCRIVTLMPRPLHTLQRAVLPGFPPCLKTTAFRRKPAHVSGQFSDCTSSIAYPLHFLQMTVLVSCNFEVLPLYKSSKETLEMHKIGLRMCVWVVAHLTNGFSAFAHSKARTTKQNALVWMVHVFALLPSPAAAASTKTPESEWVAASPTEETSEQISKHITREVCKATHDNVAWSLNSNFCDRIIHKLRSTVSHEVCQ